VYKQLYFLHIPKTAGKFISHNIKKSINDDSKCYISTHYPNNKEFLKNKIYISAHAGTFVINEIPEIDVATIVRDPISARASYFNFIYPFYLKDRPEYKNIHEDKQKFLYYLFEDKNFLIHNNYQSRFLCNSADEKSWNLKTFYEKDKLEMMKKYKEGYGFDWFVGNEKTSLELALENINNFKIVDVMERVEVFCEKINQWFIDNHNIKIDFNFNEKINVGDSKIEGRKTSSEYFINLLNENEKDRILELNSIDFNIYNFIKSKGSVNDKK
jgi:hypothetical protein